MATHGADADHCPPANRLFYLLAIYMIILIYWLLRGPKGFGLILDTHIILPITAIVFSYAPSEWYKRIVYGLIGFAVLNAIIGIGESMTHMRIFPFDPEWEVLKQDYFRASALLGHPLNNATFDAISIFVLLSIRLPVFVKSIGFLIMLVALIGFGGRSALVITCIGTSILGCGYLWTYFRTNRMTILRMTAVMLALFLVPALCGGLLYTAMHSGMGERLMAYNSLEDDSASIRVASYNSLHYLSASDAILGIDADRVDRIASHVDIASPSSDIENPWILMFMFLGGIMFTLWLCGLGGMVWRLMYGASLELKMAVICYFLIASTSNSFGRKDVVFLMMTGMVVCAKKLRLIEKNDTSKI